MDDTNFAALEHAVRSVNESSDAEPLINIMTADMTWSGAPQGWMWRRYTPS
ncbi:MAG: hypothetical protein ACR2P0_08740 [Acidimicrobiales bacterium]